jgi:hypothetical protein
MRPYQMLGLGVVLVVFMVNLAAQTGLRFQISAFMTPQGTAHIHGTGRRWRS